VVPAGQGCAEKIARVRASGYTDSSACLGTLAVVSA